MKIPESPNTMAARQEEAVRKVSKQFESLFVNQMIAAMRKTVVHQGIVPESHAEKVYRAMLDQEYAAKISETNQLGLAKMVYDHLLRKNTIK